MLPLPAAKGATTPATADSSEVAGVQIERPAAED
jgi:hypothetical protein